MDESLNEAEKLGAAMLFEQQFAWRAGRNTPPWLCERIRDAEQPGLARMARTLVDSNRDLLDVLKLTERDFWNSDGADRGRRALFAELVASRFGPLSEAHRNAIEQALPHQLTAWAREVWSASVLEELLIGDLPQSNAESRVRGQQWLLRHELHAVENASEIDRREGRERSPCARAALLGPPRVVGE